MICIALAHGHGKTAADNIAQNIVENDIRTEKIVNADLLHFFQRRDDSAAGTSLPGKRPSRLSAEHTGISGLNNVLRGKGLSGTDMIHDRKGGTRAHPPDHGSNIGIHRLILGITGSNLTADQTAGSGNLVHHPGIRPKESCRISFGIAANLQYFQTALCESDGNIGHCGRFPNAAFSVKCYLDHKSISSSVFTLLNRQSSC